MTRATLIAIALLAVGAGCGSGNGSASPSPPDASTIPDSVALDLSGTIVFTNSRPAMGGSPDSGNGGIWVMNADGTNQRLLVEIHNDVFDPCPMVSPDGTRVVYRRYEPGTGPDGLWISEIDGGAPTEVVLPPDTKSGYGPNEECPVRSPDGTRIAFSTLEGEVWIVAVDGSDQQQVPVVSDETFDVILTSWSPDGRTLAGDDVLHMSLLDIATGAVTDLGRGEHPQFSPDGTRIAFDDYEVGGEMHVELGVMDVDGTNRRVVASHPAADEHPAWSPDGKYLAFASRRTHYDLVKANPNSAEARARVGYVTAEAAFSAIYVVDPDGDDEPTLLTPIPDGLEPWDWDAQQPSWAVATP